MGTQSSGLVAGRPHDLVSQLLPSVLPAAFPLSSLVIGVGNFLCLGAYILDRGWGLLPGSPSDSGTQPRAESISLVFTGSCEQKRAGPGGLGHIAGLEFQSWLCHLTTV